MKPLQNTHPQWLVAVLLFLVFALQQSARAQAARKADSVVAQPATHTTDGVFAEPEEISPEPYGGMRNFYLSVYQRLAFDNLTDRQRAIVAFVIEKDGSLSHIKLLKSTMSKNMNAQIVRAMYMVPKWKPGSQNGQLIRVQYTIPITNY